MAESGGGAESGCVVPPAVIPYRVGPYEPIGPVRTGSPSARLLRVLPAPAWAISSNHSSLEPTALTADSSPGLRSSRARSASSAVAYPSILMRWSSLTARYTASDPLMVDAIMRSPLSPITSTSWPPNSPGLVAGTSAHLIAVFLFAYSLTMGSLSPSVVHTTLYGMLSCPRGSYRLPRIKRRRAGKVLTTGQGSPPSYRTTPSTA